MDKITIYPVDPLDMHNLGVRRFAEFEQPNAMAGEIPVQMSVHPNDVAYVREFFRTNGTFGKMAPGVEGTLYDPAKMAQIRETGHAALRDYLIRDLEITDELRKQFEVDQVIAEALEMRRRGRPAPLPKPTMIALHIFHIIETWSQYK